jgi:hypothetical protein
MASARHLVRLWNRDVLDQPHDDVVGGHAFGLCLKIRGDAVSQHGNGDSLYVTGVDGEPAIHRGQCFSSGDKILAGAGPGSPVDELLDVRRC